MVGPLVVAAAAAMVGDCALVRSMYGPGEERFSREVHAWIGNATAATRARRHAWGRAPAHEGLAFLEAFVTLSELPPVPQYVTQIGDKPNTLGVFTGTEIKLRSDLSEDTERWVAIHEILHWARFTYRGDAGPSAETTAIYDDEFTGRTAPLAFDGSHWRTASMTGTHSASGRRASEELMTSHIGSYAFLAAATLNEVFTLPDRRRSVVDHHWCTASVPCADRSECVATSTFSAAVRVGGPHRERGPPRAVLQPQWEQFAARDGDVDCGRVGGGGGDHWRGCVQPVGPGSAGRRGRVGHARYGAAALNIRFRPAGLYPTPGD